MSPSLVVSVGSAVTGGAAGTAGLVGTTGSDGCDGTESPQRLCVTTVKVTGWPATAPMTHLAWSAATVHVAGPGDAVTVYPVTSRSVEASQLTVTDDVPATAVGAATGTGGGATGVTVVRPLARPA